MKKLEDEAARRREQEKKDRELALKEYANEERRRKEQEERELIMDRLLDEERAQEEARGSGRENKALAMMMKMGFKPGQALGRDEGEAAEAEAEAAAGGAPVLPEAAGGGDAVAHREHAVSAGERESVDAEQSRAGIGANVKAEASEEARERPQEGHRKVPLAINEWEGKYLSRETLPRRT